MAGTDITALIVAVGWIAVGVVAVLALRRFGGRLRRNLPTVTVLALILLVPLFILLVRYSQASCAVLPPEQACACYAQAGFTADTQKEALIFFGRADDLCPGQPLYRRRSGRK